MHILGMTKFSKSVECSSSNNNNNNNDNNNNNNNNNNFIYPGKDRSVDQHID